MFEGFCEPPASARASSVNPGAASDHSKPVCFDGRVIVRARSGASRTLSLRTLPRSRKTFHMAPTLSGIITVMTDERRNGERAPITLKVEYKRLNAFFADYTRNISKGGTFIRTTQPLDVGTEFVFLLMLPEKATPVPTTLELTGVVKWVVTEAEATHEQPAGMGIRFLFANDEVRRRVQSVAAGLMQDALGPTLTAKLLGST